MALVLIISLLVQVVLVELYKHLNYTKVLKNHQITQELDITLKELDNGRTQLLVVLLYGLV